MRIIAAASLAIALPLAIAGCTEDGDQPHLRAANDWAIAAATPLGPPVNCIQQARIRGHNARDDRTIDFAMDDGSVLRNRLPYACAGLLRTNRFSYRTALNRVCSTDTITLIEPTGAAGGSCGLGVFQPIAVPPRQGAVPGAR